MAIIHVHTCIFNFIVLLCYMLHVITEISILVLHTGCLNTFVTYNLARSEFQDG